MKLPLSPKGYLNACPTPFLPVLTAGNHGRYLAFKVIPFCNLAFVMSTLCRHIELSVRMMIPSR